MAFSNCAPNFLRAWRLFVGTLVWLVSSELYCAQEARQRHKEHEGERSLLLSAIYRSNSSITDRAPTSKLWEPSLQIKKLRYLNITAFFFSIISKTVRANSSVIHLLALRAHRSPGLLFTLLRRACQFQLERYRADRHLSVASMRKAIKLCYPHPPSYKLWLHHENLSPGAFSQSGHYWWISKVLLIIKFNTLPNSCLKIIQFGSIWTPSAGSNMD